MDKKVTLGLVVFTALGCSAAAQPAPSNGGGGGKADDLTGGQNDDGSGSDSAGYSEGVDQNGVAYIDLPGFAYEGGVERFDWSENFRSDGSMRHDFEGTAEGNQCVVGYFKVDGPDGEEFSAKLGGGPHNDDRGEWADTHDLAIANFAGDRARIRWEEDHSEGYTDGPRVDIDLGDLRNKWVGIMGCKLNVDEDADGEIDHIWYVGYVDPEGLGAADEPKNRWVSTLDLMMAVDDVDLKSPTVPYVVTIGEEDEAQATVRIDEQDEDDYGYKYIAYRSPVAR